MCVRELINLLSFNSAVPNDAHAYYFSLNRDRNYYVTTYVGSNVSYTCTGAFPVYLSSGLTFSVQFIKAPSGTPIDSTAWGPC